MCCYHSRRGTNFHASTEYRRKLRPHTHARVYVCVYNLKSVPLESRREDGCDLVGDMRVQRHCAVNVMVSVLCQMVELFNELRSGFLDV